MVSSVLADDAGRNRFCHGGEDEIQCCRKNLMRARRQACAEANVP